MGSKKVLENDLDTPVRSRSFNVLFPVPFWVGGGGGRVVINKNDESGTHFLINLYFLVIYIYNKFSLNGRGGGAGKRKSNDRGLTKVT